MNRIERASVLLWGNIGYHQISRVASLSTIVTHLATESPKNRHRNEEKPVRIESTTIVSSSAASRVLCVPCVHSPSPPDMAVTMLDANVIAFRFDHADCYLPANGDPQLTWAQKLKVRSIGKWQIVDYCCERWCYDYSVIHVHCVSWPFRCGLIIANYFVWLTHSGPWNNWHVIAMAVQRSCVWLALLSCYQIWRVHMHARHAKVKAHTRKRTLLVPREKDASKYLLRMLMAVCVQCILASHCAAQAAVCSSATSMCHCAIVVGDGCCNRRFLFDLLALLCFRRHIVTIVAPIRPKFNQITRSEMVYSGERSNFV